MILCNGLVFADDARFTQADLEVGEGRILRMGPAGSLTGGRAIDVEGGWVLPGLVDIHLHGATGVDFATDGREQIEAALAHLGRQGVTAAVATLAAAPLPALKRALGTLLPLCGQAGTGAVLHGARAEGPFLNPDRAGAQNRQSLLQPNRDAMQELLLEAGEWLRMVDIAPELPGAPELIAWLARRCVVSLAHTEADYDQATAAFGAGATHVGHLFNAMPPFGGRQPGPAGAAFDFARQVEIISDGVHLHPSVVRSVFRWFGEGRVCLVSDSLAAAGMPDGSYTLAGQPVQLHAGRATVNGATLAGGAVSLAECCRRAVSFGVPLEHAVLAATANPARAVGLDDELGSLTPGKRADILVWNRDLQTRLVMVGGRLAVE